MDSTTGFPHDLDFEQPRVTLCWSDTFDEVLAKVHQGPVKLDPVSGGRCVLKDATLLGLSFRATFRFDREGRMTQVLLERSIAENDADSQMPEGMDEQLARHGAAIAKRRAALEQILGKGVEERRSARWAAGPIAVEHRVSFNVERGGEQIGYVADCIELSRAAP